MHKVKKIDFLNLKYGDCIFSMVEQNIGKKYEFVGLKPYTLNTYIFCSNSDLIDIYIPPDLKPNQIIKGWEMGEYDKEKIILEKINKSQKNYQYYIDKYIKIFGVTGNLKKVFNSTSLGK